IAIFTARLGVVSTSYAPVTGEEPGTAPGRRHSRQTPAPRTSAKSPVPFAGGGRAVTGPPGRSGSGAGASAVDVQDLAEERGEPGVGEERDRVGDLLRGGDAAERGPAGVPRADLLGGDAGRRRVHLQQRGVDRA